MSCWDVKVPLLFFIVNRPIELDAVKNNVERIAKPTGIKGDVDSSGLSIVVLSF